MKRIPTLKMLPLAASALLALALVGCGRDTVKVYHVETNDTITPALPPAPAAPSADASGAMPATMPPGLATPDMSTLPALKYNLPDGWTEKPATQIRVASFAVAQNDRQADVSVVPMGGMAGGDLANVNRWRGQVGLGAITEADLQPILETVEIAGQPAHLYDLAGASPGSGDAQRIIAALLHREDTTWFFKITGDATLVEAQKPAFVAFLKSVQFNAAATAPAMDLSQLPPSHPPIDGMNATGSSTAPAGDKPAWDVPAGWAEGPLAQFLVAKYLVAGPGNAEAEVNVSSLAGDGGGLAPNVNRWRSQLGLAPATDDDLAKLTTMDASGVKGTVVDISGINARTGKPAELVGVVLPLGGQTWFYKLMGDPDLVAQQKDALMKFVQSAKYP